MKVFSLMSIFFCSGPVKVVHLVYSPLKPGQFDPYNLIVVPKEDVCNFPLKKQCYASYPIVVSLLSFTSPLLWCFRFFSSRLYKIIYVCSTCRPTLGSTSPCLIKKLCTLYLAYKQRQAVCQSGNNKRFSLECCEVCTSLNIF